jgi:cell division initiation protein
MSDRLTAMDIESQEFPRKMRGYDPDDVRLYLKSVAAEVQRLHLENGELREKIGQLEPKIGELRARESTLQKTLVAAQTMSEEMKDKSRAEAELLMRESRIRAERMIQQAQDQLLRIEDEIGRAKVERDHFEKQLRAMVERQVELLDMRASKRVEPDNLHVLRAATGTEVG